MISLVSNTNALCRSGTRGFKLECKERSTGQSLKVLALKNEFIGKHVVLRSQKNSTARSPKSNSLSYISAKRTILEFPDRRWWEKDIKPNMIEIESEDELIHTLENAGDKLVIVNFYKIYDLNCKKIHPEICKIAESNPDITFLRVDYDELTNMCLQLWAIVRPLFWFFKGAKGRIATVYCTTDTINKFYNALEQCKGTNRCSLELAKGLEEYEMKWLAKDPIVRQRLVRAMYSNA